MNDKTESFTNRLNQAMKLQEVKATDIVRITGLSKQKVSQYVNGQFDAKQDAVFKMAKALNVTEAWLMGYDVPMEREANSTVLETIESLLCILHKTTGGGKNFVQFAENYRNMLDGFAKLNDSGKAEAVKRIQEMANLPEYSAV